MVFESYQACTRPCVRMFRRYGQVKDVFASYLHVNVKLRIPDEVILVALIYIYPPSIFLPPVECGADHEKRALYAAHHWSDWKEPLMQLENHNSSPFRIHTKHLRGG